MNKIINEKDLINAHACSMYNRKQLSKAKKCGCFYCLQVFNPNKILEWVDDGQTALCPFCGVDSIIYDNKTYPLSKDFLEKMYKYWF